VQTLYISTLLEFLPDLIGLFGVILILWYYFLLQTGKCTANSLMFSLANLIGSALLLISLWFDWNLSAVIIEIAWFLISLFGVIKTMNQPALYKNNPAD